MRPYEHDALLSEEVMTCQKGPAEMLSRSGAVPVPFCKLDSDSDSV